MVIEATTFETHRERFEERLETRFSELGPILRTKLASTATYLLLLLREVEPVLPLPADATDDLVAQHQMALSIQKEDIQANSRFKERASTQLKGLKCAMVDALSSPLKLQMDKEASYVAAKDAAVPDVVGMWKDISRICLKGRRHTPATTAFYLLSWFKELDFGKASLHEYQKAFSYRAEQFTSRWRGLQETGAISTEFRQQNQDWLPRTLVSHDEINKIVEHTYEQLFASVYILTLLSPGFNSLRSDIANELKVEIAEPTSVGDAIVLSDQYARLAEINSSTSMEPIIGAVVGGSKGGGGKSGDSDKPYATTDAEYIVRLKRQLAEAREATISKRFGTDKATPRGSRKIYNDKANKPQAGEFGVTKHGQSRAILWCDKHHSWGCHTTAECKGIPMKRSDKANSKAKDSEVMIVDCAPYTYGDDDETNMAFVA
jgi:hypothetical protein